jgi:hypothetical protein
MIDVEYEFKVVQVDETLNLMLVEYSCDQYDTVQVSMPLPYSDVLLENHIRNYAPVAHWILSKKTFSKVALGTTGKINPSTPTELPPAIQELSEEDIMKLVQELKTA